MEVGDEKVSHGESFYEDQGIELRLGTPVEAVDVKSREVVLGSADAFATTPSLSPPGRPPGGCWCQAPISWGSTTSGISRTPMVFERRFKAAVEWW